MFLTKLCVVSVWGDGWASVQKTNIDVIGREPAVMHAAHKPIEM